MTDKWYSFRPLQPVIGENNFFNRQRKLSARLTIRKLPKWARTKKTLEHYSSILTRGVREALYAVSTEYNAESLGAIQKEITEELALVPLAFWLAGTPLMMEDDIVHLRREGTYKVLRQAIREDRIYITPEDERRITKETFKLAKALFSRLCDLPKKGTVRLAIWSTLRALKEQHWPLRYLLYWLCLEGLFGPEDGREITFRISQRISLFLRSGSEAEEYFRRVKKSYGWRSAIVHGLRLKKLKPEVSVQLMEELEATVRECLIMVIKPKYFPSFDSEKREEYLDGLVYKK